MVTVSSHLVHGGRSGNDPIFALHQEATARRKRGAPVVNGTIGVLLDDRGQLAVLPSVARALRDVPPEAWAPYAAIVGDETFIEAVTWDTFGEHADLRKSVIAVATPGGTGALRHAFNTFLAPGETLLTTSLHWQPYATIAEEHGRHLKTFEMFGPSRHLNVDALDRALAEVIAEQGRALVVLNDPCNNPTGYSLTPDDWHGVAAVVSNHAVNAPVTVVLDAAYAAYAPKGMSGALAGLQALMGKALVLIAWSASKSLTCYGLRVGALFALSVDNDERNNLRGALAHACRGSWGTCNRGGMMAIARVLTDDGLVRTVAEERKQIVSVLDARVKLFNELARSCGLVYPPYTAGFFVTVFCEDALRAAALAREQGLFVVPQDKALRIALCAVPLQEIPVLVHTLAETLHSLPASPQ